MTDDTQADEARANEAAPFSVYARTARPPREPLTWPYLIAACLLLLVIGIYISPKGGLVYRPDDVSSQAYGQFVGGLMGRAIMLMGGAFVGAAAVWTLLWFAVLQFRRRVAAPYFLFWLAAATVGLAVPQVPQYIAAAKGVPAPRQAGDWERQQTAGLIEDLRIAAEAIDDALGDDLLHGKRMGRDPGQKESRRRIAAAQAALTALRQKLATRLATMEATANGKNDPAMRAAYRFALARYKEGVVKLTGEYIDATAEGLTIVTKAIDVVSRGHWVYQSEMLLFTAPGELNELIGTANTFQASMQRGERVRWAIASHLQQIGDAEPPPPIAALRPK